MSWIKKDPPFSRHRVVNQRKICAIHYHNDYELYHLINGKTKYFVGDEIFHLEPGNFILIPKGILHGTDSEDCMHNERIVISFDDDLFDSEARLALDELCAAKLICLPANQLYQTEELLHKLEVEFMQSQPFGKLMTRLYVQELLTLLCRLRCEPTLHESESEKLIRTVSEYISTNYAQELSLKSLSRHFALSESCLSRKFKSISGMGLNEYITHVRIHNAARLLSEGDCTITDVAAQCGFNDSNYFASVFKKIKGVTPYKYSKNTDLQA